MVNRVELHHRAKFRQNRSYRSRDMVIFRFFKMAAAAILDLQNFEFLTAGTVKGVELHQRAKFHENRLNRGRNMAIFRFFNMAAAAILNFRNFKILMVGTFKRVELHLRPKYGDYSIFQDGGRRHLGFLKFQIFNPRD